MRRVLVAAAPFAAVLFAAALFAGAAFAPVRAGVVIYRCTDQFGAVTVQNDVPCPKGSRQQKQVIDPPPPMPAYRAVAAPAPAPAPSTTPSPAPAAGIPEVVAAGARLPPPPLFQCNTFDHDSYLSEDAQAPQRCVPLQVTSVDGSGGSVAGSACQMVTDQCQRIPDGAACDAWKRRLRELEAAWKFGHADDAAANEREYRRVARLVQDSTCGA